MRRIPPPPEGANQMRAAARMYPSIVLTNAHKTQKRRRDSVHICPRYTCSPWCYLGGADDLSQECMDGFAREGHKKCVSYLKIDARTWPI